VAAAAGGSSSAAASGGRRDVVDATCGDRGRRGTLRPASDVTWPPEMTCAFPGHDSYALLFFLLYILYNVF